MLKLRYIYHMVCSIFDNSSSTLRLGRNTENMDPERTRNTELNDLRKIICLRKSEVKVVICDKYKNLNKITKI